MDKQIEELKRQLEALEKIKSVCDGAWGSARKAVEEGGLNLEELIRYAWGDIGPVARKLVRDEEAVKEAKRATRTRKPAEEPAKAAPAKRGSKAKAKPKAKRGKKMVIPAGEYRLPNEEKVYKVNVRGPRAAALVKAADEMGMDEFMRLCRISG